MQKKQEPKIVYALSTNVVITQPKYVTVIQVAMCIGIYALLAWSFLHAIGN